MDTNEAIADGVREAGSPLGRARGLIGKDGLEPGEALLIRGFGNVHTFGMRFPIDVVFCDDDMNVLHISRDLRPMRISRFVPRTRFVIELRAGGARNLEPGARLRLER